MTRLKALYQIFGGRVKLYKKKTTNIKKPEIHTHLQSSLTLTSIPGMIFENVMMISF